MISAEKTILAESVIRDVDTNNISIINILEDITAESYPIAFQKLALYSLIRREEEDDEKIFIILRVLNNDKVLRDFKFKINFKGQYKTRVNIQLRGIQFVEPGEANFVILTEDQTDLSWYTINLKVREETEVSTE